MTFTLDGREVTGHKARCSSPPPSGPGRSSPLLLPPPDEVGGVCRMCLVEVERSPRRVAAAQLLRRGPGRRRGGTASDKVEKAQDGVLEFLLVNHPLDCPVCDKGGDAPSRTRPWPTGRASRASWRRGATSRSRSPSRELVLLDRERCIQCSRCTQFADEVAGEARSTSSAGESTSRSRRPRAAVHLVLLGQHRPDLPGGGADRRALPVRAPGPGTSTRSSRPARPARSGTGWPCSRRPTG